MNITFDPTNQEESDQVKQILYSNEMSIAIFDIRYNLRKRLENRIEIGSPEYFEGAYHCLDLVFDELNDLIGDIPEL